MKTSQRSPLPVMGWREWVMLPDLGISEIKAKIDTGARSSSLYAFDIERFQDQGRDRVRFKIHPYQHNDEQTIMAIADLLDERHVKNSGGAVELRPVIQTRLSLNGQDWPIELTLTHRQGMQFRMLLGREAIRRRFLVDSGRSYLQSTKRKSPSTQRRQPEA